MQAQGTSETKADSRGTSVYIKVCGFWGIDLMRSQKTPEESFLICLLYQIICIQEVKKSDEVLRQAELWSENLICLVKKDSGTPAAACNPSKVV